MMVNSIINNWRRKTSDSTGNLGARPSCRPGCVRGDWAGHRSAPDRFLGFGSATNLTGKIEPTLARNCRFESSSLQRRVRCELNLGKGGLPMRLPPGLLGASPAPRGRGRAPPSLRPDPAPTRVSSLDVAMMLILLGIGFWGLLSRRPGSTSLVSVITTRQPPQSHNQSQVRGRKLVDTSGVLNVSP